MIKKIITIFALTIMPPLLTACSSKNEITRDTFEGKYPYSVDKVGISCHKNAVVVIAKGKMYSVNGTARSLYPEIKSDDEITLYDDEFNNEFEKLTGKKPRPLVKMSTGDVISIGLKLCK